MGERGSRVLRRVPVFWVGLLAVVVVRALVATSRADEFRGEELYIGSFAWALIRGMPLDPNSLPIIVHLRGSVVFGLLCVPLFWLLGPALVGLKALAVAWSGVCGGLFAYVLDRRAGRAAALAGVVLYALLPPSFQMVDVLALGSHGDTLLPILGALAVLFARNAPLGWRRALGLGAVCGFGCFFSMQFFVALPAVLLAWWALDRRFVLRPASLAFPPAAALLAAPIPLVSTSATLVTKPMSSHFLPDGVGGAFSKLLAVFGGDLQRSWLFEDNGGAWLGWVYLAVLVAGLVLLFPRLRKLEPLAVFCVVYPPLVLVAYAASDFELNFWVRRPGMGSRYFMPMLPFLAAWPALGLAVRRAPGTAATAVACLAGLIGLVSLCDLGTPGRRSPVRGTNLAFFTGHLEHAGGSSMRARLDWARAVEPDWDPYRPLAYANIRPAGGGTLRAGDTLGADALRQLRAFEPELRPYLLVDLGHAVGSSTDRAKVAQTIAALPADLPEPEWLLRGIGRGTMSIGVAQVVATGGREVKVYGVLAKLPEEVVVGAGVHLGFVFTPYHDHSLKLVTAGRLLPDDLRDDFYRGLGLGYRLRFREDRYEPPADGTTIEQAIAAPDRAAFRSGLTAPRTSF